MQHRREIDGLRAIAVGLVIVYHVGLTIGPATMRSGFVGVDVFFVISGFLITGLILQRLDKGEWSLVDFYRRRARRILPALVVVLAATAVLAPFVLFDEQLRDFARSLVATGLFGSNIYFWATSDYFSPVAGQQPLLHTWSLGVEEQFYLLWPLLLVALRRQKRATIALVFGAVIIASFAINVFVVTREPNTAFYLLPSRAWELAAGGMLAVLPPRRIPRAVRAAMGIGGALLLAVSGIAFTGAAYPGTNAVLPVVGALLILEAGQAGPVARLLSMRPVVFVGLVSYSWYLWHWPLVVFYKVAEGRDPAGIVVPVALAAASFALAVATYYLIETPGRRLALPPRQLLTGTAAFAAACLVVGLALPSIKSVLAPQSAEATQYLDYLQYDLSTEVRQGQCFIARGDPDQSFDASTCLAVSTDRPNVLLLGDSHAADKYLAIRDLAPDVNLLQATGSGCMPLVPLSGPVACTGVVQAGLDTWASGDVDTLILSANWAPDTFSLPQLRTTLAYLKRLHDGRIVLLGPAPHYEAPLPELLARGVVTRDPNFAEERQSSFVGRLTVQMQEIAEAEGVTFVSLIENLCPKGTCRVVTTGGTPVLMDSNHFTRAGAVAALKFFVPEVLAR